MSVVEWLLQNFELSPNMSIPRSTVYKLYLPYCNENNLEPLTAASLGKISNVFIYLRIRTLGKRGHNKDHYCGIRIIPGSAASQLVEDEILVYCQQPTKGHCKIRSCSGVSGTSIVEIENKCEQNSDNSVGWCHSNSLQEDPHQRLYLGDLPGEIIDFPDTEFPQDLPEDCTSEDLVIFRHIYIAHCAIFLDAVLCCHV
jgi:hypothetical protein